ncbi:hypothetical protein [Massilia sp. DWR3-1-1]|uniref:hypothetical protein n=1 Tax=Massilia sp. DWR3-1-1 TaxID=2804559 RepID=UPI003CFB47DE
MSDNDKAKDQAEARKERFKALAAEGGLTIFQGFCYTVGMALATIMVDHMRNRKNAAVDDVS